ncbi:MAG: ROK family protein [Candidatus Diapherotrites archaeon]
MNYSIGVDLGGSSIRSALIDRNEKIIAFNSTETNASAGKNAVLKNLVQCISLVMPKNKKIEGIGIGFAGGINQKKGIIIKSAHLPSLNGFNLKNFLQKKFRKLAVLENDANLMAYAEAMKGSARKYNFVVGITLGTGIGSGIILNKKIYSGASGTAGELGHTVINFNGPKCPCGNSGCWEEYLSIRAIMRRAEFALNSNRKTLMKKLWPLTPKKVDDSARKGDRSAMEIMKIEGQYLGIGLANIVNALNPDAIVLGGGLSNSKILVREGIKEMKKRAFRNPAKKAKVLKARFGGKAGLIGAGLIVFEKR